MSQQKRVFLLILTSTNCTSPLSLNKIQEQKPVTGISVEVKKADEEMMFVSVGVFPGCFNRLKCWLAYQLPVLHVLLPSTLQRSGPPVGHARTSYYTLHTIPNTLLSFLLNFCFHFIYFLMFFLCYLCETCSVVDLFLSESSKTIDFKFAILNLSFMHIKFSVQTIIWNETSHNF